tara:strand:- start:153 stop:446 length:294 start_codon:yes stop_codon:yes gene_type:complete
MKKTLLSKEELALYKKHLEGWEIEDKCLKKELNFDSFIEAFSFMTKIALISESMNHHPEWRNVYGHISIQLTTHESGGITELDFKLAKSIDGLNKKE